MSQVRSSELYSVTDACRNMVGIEVPRDRSTAVRAWDGNACSHSAFNATRASLTSAFPTKLVLPVTVTPAAASTPAVAVSSPFAVIYNGTNKQRIIETSPKRTAPVNIDKCA